jgi:two-component system, NarL family, nitrate/nitrite response regulator NarL
LNGALNNRVIRIILVDNHQIVRESLRVLLEQQPGFTVIDEMGSCAEALERAALAQPDVIVLDLDLGDESGLDLIANLRTETLGARIIVLTGLTDLEQHRQAVLLGAAGLVFKTQPFAILVEAIERVHKGQAWLDHGLVANIVGELARPRAAAAVDPEQTKMATLTERERRVISLVCEGLQNRAIASRLALSETTVRHHLTSIFAKLEVEHRLELLIYAFRNGLAELPQ